ncbi:MAG: NUDIX hydrolase [Gammaproteobacteria bacterium]|nr:NUDIX hydrolase [Gammaproteobacteria bacterium]HXK55529.1 NUDIX hydrolase [Gammaproteobacteria bacterium]
MNFCVQCGAALTLLVPDGDNRPRHVCGSCGFIHYQNPKIVTGVIPEWEGRVLLCRRAIEPRRGLWTLPAGFMENGESADEGAVREAMEEANARIGITGLYTLFNLTHINQVYMLYRGQLLDLDFEPGDESLEVALFSRDEVPWEALAFQVVRETLNFYFKDLESGNFVLRSGTIDRNPADQRGYRMRLLEG